MPRPATWAAAGLALLSLLVLGPLPLHAQLALTLQRAVELAVERHLDVQDALLAEQEAGLGLTQAQLAYTPNLSGSANLNTNFGTTFDFVTFSRIQQTTTLSQPQLSLNQNLFAGLANLYALRQSKAQLTATTAAKQATLQNVVTEVLTAYLQVVLDETAISQTQARLSTWQAQKQRLQALLDLGSATEADLAQLEASEAMEQANLIRQQNQRRGDRLRLLTLLQLDPALQVKLSPPDSSQLVPGNAKHPPLDDAVKRALSVAPEVQQQVANGEAARLGVQLARAAYYPTLSLSANLSSNYSSNGGVLENVGGEVTRTRTEFVEQIEDNFSQNIGLRLAVPIYTQGRTRVNVQRAEVSQARSHVQLQRAVQAVTLRTQQAWLDVDAARKQYDAFRTQLSAARKAYDQTQAQYEAGAADYFAFREALMAVTRAEAELLQARYDYFFKEKLLSLQMGEAISF